ncbi:MAG: aminoacyl-tRNA hydrolase [Planctomycetaceae bacterium]|jgi:PTH1 family peptidyl-tRNA hydrolase|nr:aminoacyl-tRNA hydrolase [Planctomycetaceae bacterium]
MKLVVGLGNPGMKYRQTRHNIGYLVLSELLLRYAGCSPKSKFHGDFVDIRDKNNETFFLLCPTTYMNHSGTSVAEAVRFYKIPLENILIVCDDLNLPFTKLRFRNEGSSGGQKGLADILRALGTEKIARLRFGIGEPPARIDASDYVLMNFTEKEKPELLIALKKAADAVQCWLDYNIVEAMNKYNGTISN